MVLSRRTQRTAPDTPLRQGLPKRQTSGSSGDQPLDRRRTELKQGFPYRTIRRKLSHCVAHRRQQRNCRPLRPGEPSKTRRDENLDRLRASCTTRSFVIGTVPHDHSLSERSLCLQWKFAVRRHIKPMAQQPRHDSPGEIGYARLPRRGESNIFPAWRSPAGPEV